MTPQPVRIPNYKRFLITGALLGLAIGVFFGLREPGGPDYVSAMQVDNGEATAFLGALGAFLGAGIAGVLAILLDRSGREK